MNWIFDDNINTDLITPGRFNITTDPEKLKKIAFIEHRPDFATRVKPGDFIIAGQNFGCGSSRETAAIALSATGILAIFAKSFARIFYRNCMNQGLLAITIDTTAIREDDTLILDIPKRLLINKTQQTSIPIEIPHMMYTLHEYGGIIPYLKTHGLDSLPHLFEGTT